MNISATFCEPLLGGIYAPCSFQNLPSCSLLLSISYPLLPFNYFCCSSFVFLCSLEKQNRGLLMFPPFCKISVYLLATMKPVFNVSLDFVQISWTWFPSLPIKWFCVHLCGKCELRLSPLLDRSDYDFCDWSIYTCKGVESCSVRSYASDLDWFIRWLLLILKQGQ